MVLQELIAIGPSKEFILNLSSSVRELKVLLQNRVKQLFDIDVYLLSCADDVELNLDVGSAVRFRIVGGENQDNLDRAKEYITGICCPEIKCRVEYPIADLLSEDKALNTVDTIEQETSAYLAITGEGFLEVCGSKMAVALATSTLEHLQLNMFHNSDSTDARIPEPAIKDPEPKSKEVLESDVEPDFEIWKKRELPSKASAKAKDRLLNDRNSASVKECNPMEKKCEVPLKPEQASETVSEEIKTESRDSEINGLDAAKVSEETERELDSDSTATSAMVPEVETEVPVGESLRDFARKLGYSEAEVTSALSKLGPEADKNSLLLELVKTQDSQKELENGSSVFERDPKPPTPQTSVDPSSLRPIVIDGSNVAMSHGNQQVFSCRGIGLAVDWFQQRGHREIKVFVPSWRKEASRPKSPIIDQEVLTRLEQDHILVWTPSRLINGRRVICYDDRFTVKLAAETDGIIVSNDNFRDLQNESSDWKKVVEQRLLMYSFVNDRFMPPDDPSGRHGPKLDEFLHKGCGKQCPYGRRCTYGNRCKYLHPERNSKTEAELQAMAAQMPEQSRVPDIPYGDVHSGDQSYREACAAPRPGRPLPPPPDMPAYLLTKPLPPTPVDSRPKMKPLPPPPLQDYHIKVQNMFPPRLRNNQNINSQMARPASDPTPVRDPYMDMNTMQDHFNQTLSMPSLEGAVHGMGLPRRGSVPQILPNGVSFPESFPSLPPGNGHSMYPPPHQNMPCPPDLVARGMVTQDGRPLSGEWIHGARGMHPSYPPHYNPNQPPGYPAQHWGMTPSFSQPPPSFVPPQIYYTSGNRQSYHPVYQRVPFRGQGNGYRTRGVPTGPDDDVTDGAGGSDAQTETDTEELRIKAYEQLTEVFPDDVEKILKVLEENPMETDVEKLTQMLLDGQEGTD